MYGLLLSTGCQKDTDANNYYEVLLLECLEDIVNCVYFCGRLFCCCWEAYFSNGWLRWAVSCLLPRVPLAGPLAPSHWASLPLRKARPWSGMRLRVTGQWETQLEDY